ncbi:hypothetical protein NFI96_013331 [Prochilodus magdalenae]|nr:hypothetical protein NFI96_013331 [Prochilodus magdalenae]
MDPKVTEELPLLVVLSSLVTLCVLVVTTVWMCWRIKAGTSSLSEESNTTDEFTLPENTPSTNTPQTENTQPTQDDPPDGENEEEEEEAEENSDS